MLSALSSTSLAFLLFSLALPAGAQSHKLNGPLHRQPLGRIALGFTQDGQVLTYSGDKDGNGVDESYSVALDGKQAPVSLPPGVVVARDGKHGFAAFDPEHDGSVALYRIRLDGQGAPVALSANFVAGGGLQELLASPDGVHVVYVADQDADEVFELYGAPIDGSALSTKMSGALVANGDVVSVSLSTDGAQVLYQADQVTDGVFQYFVAPIDGSAPAHEIVIPLVAGGHVVFAQLDATGAHLLYQADQEVVGRFELFSARTDNGAPPVKLNGPLVSGGDVATPPGSPFGQAFLLGLNGLTVLYTADQEVDGRFELYSVPVDASHGAIKLSRGSAIDFGVWIWNMSYDSAWAIYSTTTNSLPRTTELHSVRVDGSAPAQRISGTLAVGAEAALPLVSFDSAFVVFEANAAADRVHEVYGVPIDGSANPVKLHPSFPAHASIDVNVRAFEPGFWVTDDGVVYSADVDVDGRFDLYFAPFPFGSPVRKLAEGPVSDFVPLAGYLALPPTGFPGVEFVRDGELLAVGFAAGSVPVVLDALAPGHTTGRVNGYQLASDGARVLYFAGEEGDPVEALRSVTTGERRQVFRLNEEWESAIASAVSADGVYAVYTTQAGGVFSTRMDGTGLPIRLSPPDSVAFSSSLLVLGALGKTVAFSVFTSDGSQTFLMVAPIDGSDPAHVVVDRDVRSVQFSADESRIVFELNRDLHAAPADGSSGQVRLSLASQRLAPDFQPEIRLSADGNLVFYRATHRTPGNPAELFAVPADGSAAPRRLNPPLAGGKSVRNYEITSDGARAVYLADQDVLGRFEVFSVPSDGSAAPVRLHAPLSAGRAIAAYHVSPDGTRVVYRADTRTTQVVELFSVPIAGGASVRLSRDLVAGGDVTSFEISGDSKRVVYRADAELDNAFSLYSVPLTAARPNARLSAPPDAAHNVGPFALSADGSTAAFTAQRNAQHALTLFRAPVGGTLKAIEIAGPFLTDGGVSDFALSADGSVIVYRAAQDEPNVVELYSATKPSGSVPLAPGQAAPQPGKL